MEEPRHCDDYIMDKEQPLCLRRFLKYNRWPAVWQARASDAGIKSPELFATLARDEKGHCKKYGVKVGERVHIVMASRLGDVGITNNLKQGGYQVRVYIDWLKDFSEKS